MLEQPYARVDWKNRLIGVERHTFGNVDTNDGLEALCLGKVISFASTSQLWMGSACGAEDNLYNGFSDIKK